MHILFVSAYTPSRIRVRPYNFIKALARRGHSITLVCGADDAAGLEEMRAICWRVIGVPVRKTHLLWNAARALPGDLPFQAALSFGAPLLQVVQHELRRERYAVAHVEHLRASALGYALHSVPAVLDAVDCISLLFERALRGSPSLKSRAMTLLDLARTRHYEAQYTDQYDQVLVSSPEDAWALHTLRETQTKRQAYNPAPSLPHPSAPIHVVPNGVDLDYFAPQPLARQPETLVFSGKMSYHANEAAALFLGQAIMPLVWAQRPNVRLVIAGSAPTREVRALAADARITVTGYLDDLRPVIAGATLAVAPLRYGVGIQNKVLEAMALETPVVAARQVARALQAQHGVDLLLAQEAPDYAQAILALLDDPGERLRIGQAGRRYVEQYHHWNSAAAQLEQIYRAAGAAIESPAATGNAAVAVAPR